MPIEFPEPSPHVRPLIEALLQPERCLELNRVGWEKIIRTARRARLLGVLSARIAAVVGLERIDVAARRHLIAGHVESSFRKQKTLYLLATIEPHLGAPETPSILLKGSAYFAQRLAFAEGRLPADVDVMVPREALDRIERSLLNSGWQFEKTEAYDQHFYRAWSHELPPLQCAGQALELDLHHTILPPLGRLKPDTNALFAAARRLPGSSFSVLLPADQVLLTAAHLFHDSDCADRLRDLVDIDGLLRAFAAADREFWATLLERARIHNLGRPLWYALVFARGWLATPVPEATIAAMQAYRPNPLAGALWKSLMAKALPPVDPDREPTWSYRSASRVLEGRATYLRMPPGLLAYHAANKAMRGIRNRFRNEREGDAKNADQR